MKTTLFIFLLVSSVFAEDVMVERMQSVVDEVTELRSRYKLATQNNEACQKQVREQEKIIEEVSQNEGLNYKTFEENRKRLDLLEEENSALKKRLEARAEEKGISKEILGLKKELEALVKENTRLNTSEKTLREKNRSLLDQLNTLKGTPSSRDESSKLTKELRAVQEKLKRSQETNRGLKQQIKDMSAVSVQTKIQPSVKKEGCDLLSNENRRLEQELQVLKTKTASLQKKCVPKTVTKVKQVTKTIALKRVPLDDNPFPKLMMKDEKPMVQARVKKRLIDKEKVPNTLEEDLSEDAQTVILEKGRTYRLKQESAVYDAPGGEVIAVWEDKTSFTSNIYKGEWIKITGHFINRKWTKSAEEMWVKVKDTVKR